MFEGCYFTNCRIQGWHPIFIEHPSCSDILINAFRYNCQSNRMKIFAFVIMPDHFHLVWQVLIPEDINTIKHSLLKFTGQEFRKYLLANDPYYLQLFESKQLDREYHFWSPFSRNYPLYNEKVLIKKIFYTHSNPTRGNYKSVKKASDYQYSSARFYESMASPFDFLSKPPV